MYVVTSKSHSDSQSLSSPIVCGCSCPPDTTEYWMEAGLNYHGGGCGCGCEAGGFAAVLNMGIAQRY